MLVCCLCLTALFEAETWGRRGGSLDWKMQIGGFDRCRSCTSESHKCIEIVNLEVNKQESKECNVVGRRGCLLSTAQLRKSKTGPKGNGGRLT